MVATDRSFLVNNIAHSIFKQISVRLNGTLISPQTDTYHYKAYIETLLNYNRDDGETILKPQGWFSAIDLPDTLTANQFDKTHNDFKNLSDEYQHVVKTLLAENAKSAGAQKRVFCFVPHIEVFHLSKLLVPNVQIGIQMYFNPPVCGPWDILGHYLSDWILQTSKWNCISAKWDSIPRSTGSWWMTWRKEREWWATRRWEARSGLITSSRTPGTMRSTILSRTGYPTWRWLDWWNPHPSMDTPSSTLSPSSITTWAISNKSWEEKPTPLNPWNSFTTMTVKTWEVTGNFSKPQEVYARAEGTLPEPKIGDTVITAPCSYMRTQPTDVWTVQYWTPSWAENCDWFWILQPNQEPTSRPSSMLNLKIWWRSIVTEPCSTTSIKSEDGKSSSQQRAIGSIGRQSTYIKTLLLRDSALRSTAHSTQPERSRGLHRQHRSRRTTGSTLVGLVDLRRRVRDPRQLCLTVEDVWDHITLASMVGSALEVGDTERTEYSIP